MRKNPFPTEIEAKRHLDFHRSRCQARFRNESWEITEDEWNVIWTLDRYQRRGRGEGELCVMRLNPALPWRMDNICVISRKLQLRIRNYMTRSNREYRHLFKQAEWIK